MKVIIVRDEVTQPGITQFVAIPQDRGMMATSGETEEAALKELRRLYGTDLKIERVKGSYLDWLLR